MAKYLKTGLPSVESDAANVKVQETVAKIIADVRQRGDAAVRELSDRFDGWSPPDFRLSLN
jgi:sulfopropanediol 3-dehydrogenase